MCWIFEYNSYTYSLRPLIAILDGTCGMSADRARNLSTVLRCYIRTASLLPGIPFSVLPITESTARHQMIQIAYSGLTVHWANSKRVDRPTTQSVEIWPSLTAWVHLRSYPCRSCKPVMSFDRFRRPCLFTVKLEIITCLFRKLILSVTLIFC